MRDPYQSALYTIETLRQQKGFDHTPAMRDVWTERKRQIEREGYDPAHDDAHTNDEMSRAAVCYVIGNGGNWPWEMESWKPADRRRNLVKAAALIIAEIERLDRAALSSEPHHG